MSTRPNPCSSRGWLPLPALLAILLLSGLLLAQAALAQEEEADPPEVVIGERLFLETRFAEFFARHSGGDVNGPLSTGDPVMDETVTTGAPLAGPFAGESMNCRSCHMVDEQLDVPGGGMRTYADFARRSPIPAREDGALTSVRNSPPLVNASLPRPGGVILHFDGEFASLPDLVRGTLSGRNYGWLPGEAALAEAHVAAVIRGDDGSGPLAADFGGLSYATTLTGTDPAIPEELRLPEDFRADVASATDRELFDAVANLISAYTEQLVFAQDETGRFAGSAFDRFVEANDLPAERRRGESPERFLKRLRKAVARLDAPVFVNEGPLTFHDHDLAFGPDELSGLEVFLAEPPRNRRRPAESGVGNCTACHAPPDFTDFTFRNTGVTQVEYDDVHGPGSFARLHVPRLGQRRRGYDRWLPATERHPEAQGPFRQVVSPEDPRHTDLGVWNIFANPDVPGPQEKLFRSLCEQQIAAAPNRLKRSPFHQLLLAIQICRPSRLLDASVARFKTPGLRDLGHSGPYMHNGAFDSLEDVLGFYQDAAALAREGGLRNGDPAIAEIRMDDGDVSALAAFLRSLDEDYE